MSYDGYVSRKSRLREEAHTYLEEEVGALA